MDRLDASGWLPGVARVASPFCDARPASAIVDLILIHNISLPPGRFGSGDVVRLFAGTLDPGAHPFYAALAGASVSAHFFVDRDGTVVQFVSTRDRAWHAGASRFEGRAGCNDFSVGIELEGTDFTAFAEEQYLALDRLLVALQDTYPVRAVRGHSDVAAERKTDPGPFFDWHRLRASATVAAALLPTRARA